MAKIVRYNGNLQAFASQQLGSERTIFGEVTSANDITSQFSPDFLRGWGIVGPADQPSLQDFNAVGYTHGQILAYLHQMGVPEFNAGQEYHTGSVTQVGGVIYVSQVDNNTGNTPSTSPVQWRSLVDLFPSASETVQGKIEIATQAETDAGTDDARAVTPKKLRFGFAVQLSTNGFVKLPSWLGGLVFQWGTVSKPSAANVNVTWPMQFPTAFGRCIASFGGTVAPTAGVSTGSPTTTGAVFVSSVGGAGIDISYFTVGW